jgi:hypothetical protein
MVVSRFAGCVMRGLSTDSKPSHAGLLGFVFQELDTGSMWYHDGSTWVLIIGPNKVETLQNKTINLDQGNVLENMVVSPFVQSFKRVGHFTPISSNPLDGLCNGAMGGWPHAGTVTYVYNTAAARYVNEFNTTGSGAQIGFFSDTVDRLVTRREFFPYLHMKLRVTNITSDRLYVGFSTATPMLLSDTTFANADSGVIMGFNTATANFSVFRNDGLGAQASAVSLGVAKDTNWHDFEITMTAGDVTCKFDDGAGAKTQVFTTKIPAMTTDIFAHSALQTAATGSRDITIAAGTFRSNQ